MARNRNFINAQRGFLERLVAEYTAPKVERDIVASLPNFRDMTTEQIEQYYENQQLFTDNINKNYIEENTHNFYCKDGTTNVYAKRGFDTEIDEVLDRQLIEKQNWRLETTNTNIDFKAGGRVVIGDRSFYIIKVVNQMSTQTTQNKFYARRNMKRFTKLSVKLLILV